MVSGRPANTTGGSAHNPQRSPAAGRSVPSRRTRRLNVRAGPWCRYAGIRRRTLVLTGHGPELQNRQKAEPADDRSSPCAVDPSSDTRADALRCGEVPSTIPLSTMAGIGYLHVDPSDRTSDSRDIVRGPGRGSEATRFDPGRGYLRRWQQFPPPHHLAGSLDSCPAIPARTP